MKARRGDGTFGELVPGESVVLSGDYEVGRGVIATIEIGAECKIINKAMIKQIDRTMNDLRTQTSHFKRGTGSRPITVAVVGVNHASKVVSYEGRRRYPTGWVEEVDPDTGATERMYHPHPIEEAAEAVKRLNDEVRPHYDEMILLRYSATNENPFPFSWVSESETVRDYATALTKISREYEQRF